MTVAILLAVTGIGVTACFEQGHDGSHSPGYHDTGTGYYQREYYRPYEPGYQRPYYWH